MDGESIAGEDDLDAPDLPSHIGKYRVLRRLGEGATAEVFLCHDDFKGIDVAIKRVRPNVTGDAMDGRYSERFFAAEAALVGRTLDATSLEAAANALLQGAAVLPQNAFKLPLARRAIARALQDAAAMPA